MRAEQKYCNEESFAVVITIPLLRSMLHPFRQLTGRTTPYICLACRQQQVFSAGRRKFQSGDAVVANSNSLETTEPRSVESEQATTISNSPSQDVAQPARRSATEIRAVKTLKRQRKRQAAAIERRKAKAARLAPTSHPSKEILPDHSVEIVVSANSISHADTDAPISTPVVSGANTSESAVDTKAKTVQKGSESTPEHTRTGVGTTADDRRPTTSEADVTTPSSKERSDLQPGRRIKGKAKLKSKKKKVEAASEQQKVRAQAWRAKGSVPDKHAKSSAIRNTQAKLKVRPSRSAAKGAPRIRKVATTPHKSPPPDTQARASSINSRRVISRPSSAKSTSSQQNARQRSNRRTGRERSHEIGNKFHAWAKGLLKRTTNHETRTIDGRTQRVKSIDVVQPSAPRLAHNLDRVLFNPGVYQLKDPNSGVYNFDPYLEKVMPVEEFDFSALKAYRTSSEDSALATLARTHEKRYVGSTSSMTSVLSQFHLLLSRFRSIDMSMLSRSFKPESERFTKIVRAPQSIFLRWKNGTYAIDADKEYDTPNVLMLLGKSMEKLLTMSKHEFERYRKSTPEEVPASNREAEEPFQYTELGDMLMRSQLDSFDPRLKRNGTFDLKTRCVLSIRMDSESDESRGYEIIDLRGQYMSYEREYHDMIRSTMLKYMLQARMGRMEGIFVAYHNIERIFGFQYISLAEIDKALHGDSQTHLGSEEFTMSLLMLNDLLNKATERFPEQSLRVTFETTGTTINSALHFYAEPFSDPEIDAIQSASKQRAIEFEEKIMNPEPATATDTTSSPATESVAMTGDAQDVGSKDNLDVNSPQAKPEEQVEEDGAPVDATAGSLQFRLPSLQSELRDMQTLPEIAQDQIKDITSHLVRSGHTTAPDPAPARTYSPLYAAIVVFESTVNGAKVVRPRFISPESDWKVKYTVCELSDQDLSKAWKEYETCRERRKRVFTEHSTEPDATNPAKIDWFIKNLRKMAQRGRTYRKKQEELAKDQPVLVYS